MNYCFLGNNETITGERECVVIEPMTFYGSSSAPNSSGFVYIFKIICISY